MLDKLVLGGHTNSMSTYLELRPARTEEVSPVAQVGMLSSFLSIGKPSLLDILTLSSGKTLSLEIASIDQKTRFFLHAPGELKSYFTSQVLSHYPKTLVTEEKTDPLFSVIQGKKVELASLELVHGQNYPIKTYKQFGPGQWPLSAALGFLARLQPTECASIQILLRVPWNQDNLQKSIRGTMKIAAEEGKTEANPYSKSIQEKLSTPLLETQVRLVFAGTASVKDRLSELAGSFGIYTMAEGNSFIFKHVSSFLKKNVFSRAVSREFSMWQNTMVLNLDEVASLWHLPDKSLEQIKAINWGKTFLSEAPDKLPVASQFAVKSETTPILNKLGVQKGEMDPRLRGDDRKMSGDDKGRHSVIPDLVGNPDRGDGHLIGEASMERGDEKRDVNFFARTEWRNHDEIFGIKREDRSKHVYIIGKTGAGKSTLIANMAINDIRNGEGVAVIDPHGDLSEMILDYIPKRRLADVVYLDPTLSEERAFSLNLFDSEASAHMDVVASGIISVFYKLYGASWGPRLEYILRNTIYTLLYHGDSTFGDILRILADKKFREKILTKVGEQDRVMSEFWRNEYDKMTEKLRIESISSIQNKVGQFVSSLRIRHIVDSKHSTFSLPDIMNNGKILIINLSQGKLGEDNTALLGAIFITKMQLTAMQRVNMPADKRRDFYLYVDEFQNFATSSFIKILSEARKYRLNLILANQYVGQVDEEVQKAIFGNVGTLVTFLIGAGDAGIFSKEFGGKFTPDDLVALGKFQILMKMAIDGLTSDPFMAYTLPLPSVRNENKDKIIRMSLEKYYKK